MEGQGNLRILSFPKFELVNLETFSLFYDRKYEGYLKEGKLEGKDNNIQLKNFYISLFHFFNSVILVEECILIWWMEVSKM